MPSRPWNDDDAPSRSLHATARSIPRHHAMPTRHTWRPGDTWFRCGSTTPRSKADINQRWSSGGHILACDMLICPTDTRSKNMPTRQPPYIQLEPNFRWPFADCPSTFIAQKDLKMRPKLIGCENIEGGAGSIAQNIAKMKSEAKQISSEAKTKIRLIWNENVSCEIPRKQISKRTEEVIACYVF